MPAGAPLLTPYHGREPRVELDAWAAPGTTLIGAVVLRAGASVWYGCVVTAT